MGPVLDSRRTFKPGVWYVKLLSVSVMPGRSSDYLIARFEVEQYIPADNTSRSWDEFLDFLPGTQVDQAWGTKYSAGHIKTFIAACLDVFINEVTPEVADEFVIKPPIGLHFMAYAAEIATQTDRHWTTVTFSRSPS